MLRRWLYEQTVSLLAVPAAKVLEAGAWGLTVPGVDTTPEPPFTIIRGGTYDPRGRQVGRSQRFFLYVHDRQGSYAANIEPMLLTLANGLPDRAPMNFNGWHITACEFEGTSDDLIDADKSTAMRYGQFRITGRPLGSS